MPATMLLAALWLIDGAPLARVGGGSVRRAKCGEHYDGSAKGDRWTAIDFWGQPTGEVEVSRTTVYDITGCRELEMRVLSGTDRAGLHTRGTYHPQPSFDCGNRTKVTVASLASLLKTTARAKSAQDVKVFCDHGAVRGVATGRGLTIAHYDAQGMWITDVVPREDDKTRTKVRMIADMNGDGHPEIVVHEEDDDGYDDVVWTIDARRRWIRLVKTDGAPFA